MEESPKITPIPDGYKEPFGDDDTAEDRHADAKWTKNLIGDSWRTKKHEDLLRRIKESRGKE